MGDQEYSTKQNKHSSAYKYTDVSSGTRTGILTKLIKLVTKK